MQYGSPLSPFLPFSYGPGCQAHQANFDVIVQVLSSIFSTLSPLGNSHLAYRTSHKYFLHCESFFVLLTQDFNFDGSVVPTARTLWQHLQGETGILKYNMLLPGISLREAYVLLINASWPFEQRQVNCRLSTIFVD